MAKRPKKRVGPFPHENDIDSISAWAKQYLLGLRVRGYSDRTLVNQESYLRLFAEWADLRSLVYPQEVTRPVLEKYQRHLYHLRQKTGRPLSFRAQVARLIPIRRLFAWLTRQNVLLANPASELDLPRKERRLPRAVLTAAEAERVLAQPDVADLAGLRDRAILELLYATGVRRMETANLQVFDFDLERQTLLVRQGKGKRDRMLPVGSRASAWLHKYLEDARPELVLGQDEGALFLHATGQALTPDQLTKWVRAYVDASGIGKKGSCHLFRHTMATLMLEGGADIRFVQKMLGHASLETTQIYTHVSIRKLQEVHAATHPGARLEARPVVDDERPVAGVSESPSREAVEAALDAERRDDD